MELIHMLPFWRGSMTKVCLTSSNKKALLVLDLTGHPVVVVHNLLLIVKTNLGVSFGSHWLCSCEMQSRKSVA